MSNDNYPDDIRNYDNDPRSPFYKDPDAWMADKATEMAENWHDELGHTGKIEYEDWTLADLVILMTEDGLNADDPTEAIHYLEAHVLKIIEANPEQYNPNPSPADLAWN
jgi:hypothetical protein